MMIGAYRESKVPSMRLPFFTLLLALSADPACTPADPPQAPKADPNGTPGVCQPCEFLNQTGVCVDEENDIARDALEDKDLRRIVSMCRDRCAEGEVCLFCNDPR